MQSVQPLDRNVFLSLLALDSYNRGPGAGLFGFPVEGGIGKAIILTDALAELDRDNVLAAGFYAVAYQLDDETIISYRGTNFPGGNKSSGQNSNEFNDFLRDFFGGWSLFTGFTRPVQVEFARDFYEEVTGESFRGESGFSQPSNITLTGHSLGGALAGYVGSRSDADAFVFDPIPFGDDVSGQDEADRMIGTARITQDANDPEGVAQAAGFYAIAYEWNGETIISYRGTNFFDFENPTEEGVREFQRDLWRGWNFFLGFDRPNQADLARAFYEDVTDNTFRGEADFITPPDFGDDRITLTGHSLGGGLAAYNDNFVMEKAA